MKTNPLTTAHVNIESQNFSKKLVQGKVSAGQFEWKFIWAFGISELTVTPPLGRALIQDSLKRFLVKDDYKLEPGGEYFFTIRAKI